MTNSEYKAYIKKDLKRVVKNLFKLMNKKIYIKDIKGVTEERYNFAGGIDHIVVYTVSMKNGEVFELEAQTLDKYGNYSRYSGDFRPVRFIKK
jgi:hypothetical protein